MRRIRVGVTLLVLLIASLAATLHADQPPTLEIAPINREYNDALFDSLRTGTPLILPPLKSSQKVDPNIAGIWAGSTTQVNLTMSDITLRFRRKVDELVAAAQSGRDLTNELIESFEIVLKASHQRVEMRHSAAESKNDAYGLWVPLQHKRPQTIAPFIPGQKDSGVYIAVLPVRNRESQWATYVCPRKVVQDRRTRRVGLESSMYELFEVKVGMAADVDAVLSTAGQVGRVKATIELSKDLPASDLTEDESISTVPRALLKYKPQTPFDFFRFKPQSDVQQGAQIVVEMQNKAGYLRRQYFTRFLYVHKTEEQTGIPVFIGNGRVQSDSGECYIVIEHANSWIEYDRQPIAFEDRALNKFTE